jgi:beta-phosphoglucomutase family hydrolase
MHRDQLPIAAVLFDMDGVVTDTASAHARAWKELFDHYLRNMANRSGETFRPFDIDRDYHSYVDGKPRHDGIRSFLESRGIRLPLGAPDDDVTSETIYGLGNRKNLLFQRWLTENRVQAFPGTVTFIGRMKAMGIRTAIFSSSCNAEAVLRSAGVLDLFEARVDGNDLLRLDMPGKPAPAMLLETASRLGVPPARTAVIEDAVAGVQAAVAGHFRLVVGIDRGDNAQALRHAGADIVVRDLNELDWDRMMSFTPRSVPP